MRILIIHNYYAQAGGEDHVFESESKLLEEHDNEVKKLVFHNETTSRAQKIYSILNLFYNFKSARILKRAINQFKPDIIHVHNFFLVASPSVFIVARKKNIPVVLTLHNYRLVCPSATLFYDGKIVMDSINQVFPLRSILRRMYRDSFFMTAGVVFMTGFHKLIGTWKKIDGFVVMSPFAKQIMTNSSLKLDASKVYIKQHFTSEEIAADNFAYKREDFFLFIGRLSEEKGISVLLESLKAGSYRLKIIGDGPMKDIVVRFAEEQEGLEYLGYLGKNEINRELSKCKALIIPSICHETFGITAIEAFKNRTPVIASKVGALQTVVQPQVNGLLFEAGDTKGLNECLEGFTFEMTEKLGQNGYRSYQNLYTSDKNYNLLVGMYKSIIEKSRTS